MKRGDCSVDRMSADGEIFNVFKEKKLESLTAMDTELQKIAAKLHDNSA